MDLITFAFSIISFVIALYSVWLSKKSDEYEQFQIIMNMYSNLKVIESDVVKYRSGSPEEDATLFAHSKEQLLNHYEIYCLHYIRGSINQTIFEQLFKENIKRIVNNEVNKKYFDESNKDYNFEFILKAHKQINEKKKIVKWWSKYVSFKRN